MASLTSSNKSRPFTVLVEGNIASGKTTFLNHFINSKDVLLLTEPVEKWSNVRGHNLLSLMYEDPSRWGMALQTYVQLTMVDLHTQRSNHSVKIMERSIFSARYCFVENFIETGIMPPAESSVLDEWFKWITTNLDVGADLIVYLRTEPEVVYKRMQARARQEETSVSLEYLQQLHKLHENWLYTRTSFSCPAPVLVLDANQSMNDMKNEYTKHESTVLHQKLETVAGNL